MYGYAVSSQAFSVLSLSEYTQITVESSYITQDSSTLLQAVTTVTATPVQTIDPSAMITTIPTPAIAPSSDLCTSRWDCKDRGECTNVTEVKHKICRCDTGYFGSHCQFRDEEALQKFLDDSGWKALAFIFIAISIILLLLILIIIIHVHRSKPASATKEIELLTKKYRKEAGLKDSHTDIHDNVKHNKPNHHRNARDGHDLGVTNPDYRGNTGHRQRNGHELA